MFNQVTALPLTQGGYIIFASVGSGVFFEELEALDSTGVACFAAGMGLIVAGCVTLVFNTSSMQSAPVIVGLWDSCPTWSSTQTGL